MGMSSLIVIGAGYAGLLAARRACARGLAVTLVSERDVMVDRIRLHEVVAGIRSPEQATRPLSLRTGEVVVGEITIGSDATYFRHARILQYYGRKLGIQGRMRYFAGAPGPEDGPRWMLLHGLGDAWPYGDVYRDPAGRSYRLVRRFPYAGLSGWQTGVYENERATAK